MSQVDSLTVPAFFQTKHSRDANKYDYGHLVIYGGAEKTGAVRLAGLAALRAGAGLVTITSRREVMPVYQLGAPEFMVEQLDEAARFVNHIEDARRNVVLIGPGAGLENRSILRKAAMDSLRYKEKVTILDADALNVISDDPAPVFKLMHGNTVLTPHRGEFDRLFPDLADMSAREAALEAQRRTCAIIVLKGSDTVVAWGEGEAEMFDYASPWLATAGTGDVLAGMIAGLCGWHAHHNKHEAVLQAVWMHSHASHVVGQGLIASDLIDSLHVVWASM